MSNANGTILQLTGNAENLKCVFYNLFYEKPVQKPYPP